MKIKDHDKFVLNINTTISEKAEDLISLNNKSFCHMCRTPPSFCSHFKYTAMYDIGCNHFEINESTFLYSRQDWNIIINTGILL